MHKGHAIFALLCAIVAIVLYSVWFTRDNTLTPKVMTKEEQTTFYREKDLEVKETDENPRLSYYGDVLERNFKGPRLLVLFFAIYFTILMGLHLFFMFLSDKWSYSVSILFILIGIMSSLWISWVEYDWKLDTVVTFYANDKQHPTGVLGNFKGEKLYYNAFADKTSKTQFNPYLSLIFISAILFTLGTIAWVIILLK